MISFKKRGERGEKLEGNIVILSKEGVRLSKTRKKKVAKVDRKHIRGKLLQRKQLIN